MPWVLREEPWYRIDVQYCEVTGQLLPRRYWEFDHEGRVVRARDQRCETLYREYVVGRGLQAAPEVRPADTTAEPAWLHRPDQSDPQN